MIDLHSHVLPGVDDGARTIEGSLEILRDAARDGTRRIAATPHVRADYPTTAETMERLVDEVSEAAAAEGIAIEVLRGGEVDLEFARRLDDATLRRFGLGGSPDLLLLEVPYAGWPLDLPSLVFRLAARGFRTVLAHPERNPEVRADPELLRPLVHAGAVAQLTAASVDGRLGRRTQACARTLLDEGLAHLLASDSHAPSVRAPGLAAAAAAVGEPRLARWLTEEVPAALLAAEPLPPRPARSRTGRLRGRRRRSWH